MGGQKLWPEGVADEEPATSQPQNVPFSLQESLLYELADGSRQSHVRRLIGLLSPFWLAGQLRSDEPSNARAILFLVRVSTGSS